MSSLPTQSESIIAQRMSFAILGALVMLVAFTFRDYGISWDEELQNTYGDKLLAMYRTLFADRSALSYVNLYFYGGFFDLCTAFVNQFTPFDHYATRHLMGGLMGVIGYLGVWRLTKLLAGDWAALLALAVLASSPLLYGHMFINPKDAPFAWLTVWVLYYGARALMEGPNVTRAALIGLSLSLGFALGQRVLAVAWLLALAGTLGVSVMAEQPTSPRAWLPAFWVKAKRLVWVLPPAILIMAFFWPWSVTAPFNIGTAINEFLHFPWTPPVLWDGEVVMSDDLPPGYLPLLLLVQLPEVVIIGLGAALAVALLRINQHRVAYFTRERTQAFVLITVVTFLPIAACALLDPTLYNGMRHFLFVVPLLGIIGAIGLERVVRWVFKRTRVLAYVMVASITFGITHQAWVGRELHPNEYVYYNAFIGGLKGAEGLFEMDYWGTSLREATSAVDYIVDRAPTPPGGWKIYVCANQKSVMYFLSPEKVTLTQDQTQADFYVGLRALACRDAPIERGRVISEVQRYGVTFSRAIDLRKQP
jgi:hypothetical protein